PPAKLVCDRLARDSSDDQAEEDVVRVRVRPALAGREQRLVVRGEPDELLRRPRTGEVAAQVGPEQALVLRVVVEAARVVEELPYGDVLALRDQPGQPPLDRVVEPELALADELEDDDGHERLRDAADAKAVGDAH